MILLPEFFRVHSRDSRASLHHSFFVRHSGFDILCRHLAGRAFRQAAEKDTLAACAPQNCAARACLLASGAFWAKFANLVKSGCISRELKTMGPISRRATAGASAFAKATAEQAAPGYSKTGIRKSKTSRWRAAALIALNLFMIAHIIQWRVMGKTVSPIEPSETMHTLQRGAINAGFIFFSLAILATLIFGRFVCGWGCHILALQDLCGWFLKKIGLHPKPF